MQNIALPARVPHCQNKTFLLRTKLPRCDTHSGSGIHLSPYAYVFGHVVTSRSPVPIPDFRRCSAVSDLSATIATPSVDQSAATTPLTIGPRARAIGRNASTNHNRSTLRHPKKEKKTRDSDTLRCPVNTCRTERRPGPAGQHKVQSGCFLLTIVSMFFLFFLSLSLCYIRTYIFFF